MIVTGNCFLLQVCKVEHIYHPYFLPIAGRLKICSVKKDIVVGHLWILRHM